MFSDKHFMHEIKLIITTIFWSDIEDWIWTEIKPRSRPPIDPSEICCEGSLTGREFVSLFSQYIK